MLTFVEYRAKRRNAIEEGIQILGDIFLSRKGSYKTAPVNCLVSKVDHATVAEMEIMRDCYTEDFCEVFLKEIDRQIYAHQLPKGKIVMVDIDKIVVLPQLQMRKPDRKVLAAMVSSIKTMSLVHALDATRKLVLMNGFIRLKGAILAGETQVPIIVRDDYDSVEAIMRYRHLESNSIRTEIT